MVLLAPEHQIAEGLDHWPPNTPLRVQPTLQGLPDAMRSFSSGNNFRTDGIPVELIKIALNGDPTS